MRGIKASPGIAIGQAYLLQKDIKIEKATVEDRKKELARLDEAIAASIGQLKRIMDKVAKEMGENAATIFDAHIMILEDPEFIPEIRSYIEKEGTSAEYAVAEVVKKYAEMFDAMKDTYLKERAADIKDVGNRIISNLRGQIYDLSEIPNGTIVVARDLSPSDTAQMDKSKVEAFLTDEGGKTSHTAIMARTMEIPAVVGLGDVTHQVKDGDIVIVDGNEGEVYLNPDNDTLSLYMKKKEEYEEYKEKLKSLTTLPALTRDGRKVELEANIGTPKDVEAALSNGAEGIGLFRTEFLYMDRNNLPTEDEQFEAYKKVVTSMGCKRVTIRTLDIGGDKDIPYLGLEKEENPFLGWRAIRFCLDRPEIFKTQLRAILRASAYGKVSIMYPMISDIEEVRKANKLLEEAKSELRSNGIPYDLNIEVGIMVEIPSAALTADILAREVDFFSIGTNDLTQYTLAVDRGNQRVRGYYNYFQPGVLRLIKYCIEQAHKHGIYTAMCGEMAGDPEATKILLGLGLDVFSMSASSIPLVKDVIRNTTMEEARALAEKALMNG
ncbi:phosphoenolpyruvate--protein phosphotransferase [Calorimonas adulescens]|uniref:Phosphoenolpyruvate-protein phosphotransferase n=1 Tax=Calorimonas adulescens TaxID=2606906 RepID=A0A5D8QGH2_9THEO|nr:phosphoenolpyruvate--protein phosphotransferase [Calorimonas adulescens]TZE82946.1 phosphoenolpyruvate--protein phosphotransferase [Calorimonas adulescens]